MVFDLYGKTLLNGTYSNTTGVEFSNFPKGAYILKLQTLDQIQFVKVLKE